MGRRKQLSLVERLEQRRLLSTDLQGSLALSVAAYAAGANINANFTLKNNGDSTVTPTFNINFRLSTNNVYGDGDDLGSLNIPVSTDIPPGGFNVNVGIQVPLPVGLAAGSYYVVGKVDSGGTVAESNEANNVFVSTGAGVIDVLDSSGRLLVNGTDSAETISIDLQGGAYAVKVGGSSTRTYGLNVLGVLVDAKNGDDVIFVNDDAGNCSVFAGDGNDKIVDTGGSNTLSGGAGKDTVFGGNGNDRLNGNGGNDRCYGEAGTDRLFGYDGNDYLDGGSSRDRFYPGNGVDSCYGQGGDDLFYSKGDGSIDNLFGATGIDGAQHDASDILAGIEQNIP